MNAISAIIVTFNPSIETVRETLTSLQNGVSEILIVDNASAETVLRELRELSGEFSRVTVVSRSDNDGIGVAFNEGIRQAMSNGSSHVLLLDHDSVPAPGMVDVLSETLAKLQENHRVAAVGPCVVNQDTGTAMNFISYRKGLIRKAMRAQEKINDKTLYEVDHLISSGSLIPVSVLNETGLFNEDFFIDAVDTEWCFRVKAQGYALFGVEEARLRHSLGERTREINLGHAYECRLHSPQRHYYKTRNALLLCRERSVPFLYKLFEIFRIMGKLVMYPLFAEEKKLSHVHYMLRGILHGIIGKRGKTVQ